MEGEERTSPLRSNNASPTTIDIPPVASARAPVWVVRVEDPSHVWVKEPFSPAIMRLCLAAPLERDDLVYCLGRTGLESTVLATLTASRLAWCSDERAFRIHHPDDAPGKGRPGIVICRTSSSMLLPLSPSELSPFWASATPANDDREEEDHGRAAGSPPFPAPLRTMPKRRGFGRTMV